MLSSNAKCTLLVVLAMVAVSGLGIGDNLVAVTSDYRDAECWKDRFEFVLLINTTQRRLYREMRCELSDQC